MMDKELEFGTRLAREAGDIAMRYFRTGIRAEEKADLSPVTAADRECERRIAARLEQAFPDDGLLGEEGSQKDSRSGRRWIIDPIDGTRDFLRGNPHWAVLLALEDAGEVVAGWAWLPALNEMFRAAKGAGAWCNDQPIRASNVKDPAQAVLCLNGFNAVQRYAFAPRLLAWLEPFWAVRSMGGCVDAVMVARGQADLWIEPTGQAWDFAPLKILAQEAGARFFDFQGRDTMYGGNCVICAPGLEPAARELLCV